MVKRLCGWLVAAAVLTAAMTLPAVHSARAASAGGQTATVTFSGSYDDTITFDYIGSSPAQLAETKTEHVSWTFTWTGPMSKLTDQSGEELTWTHETLTGSTSDVYTDPSSQGCSDSSLQPAPGQRFDAIRANGDSKVQISTFAPNYQSSSCSLHLACPAPPVSYTGTYCNPSVSWNPEQGPRSFPFSGGIHVTGVDEDRTGHATSTLSVSGAACGTGRGPSATRAVAAADAVKLLHDGKPVGAKPIDVVIGQPVKLAVQCDGKRPASAQWIIPSWDASLKQTSVVRDYSVTDSGESSHGTPEPLPDPRSISTPSLTVHFIRSGRFKVSVRTADGEDTATVSVERPSVTSQPPWTVCKVDANNSVEESNGTGKLRPFSLGMGLNDSCGHRYGIVWDWEAKAPDGPVDASGEIAMVQLFEKHEENNRTTLPQTLAKCVEQTPWEADGSSFYPNLARNHQVKISGGGSARFQARDAPFVRLTNPLKFYFFGFRARDYLMYRSSKPGSIWIPLGEMIWSFDAKAEPRVNLLRGVRWTASVSEQPRPVFTDRVIAPLPSWTKAWQGNSACN